MTDIIQPISAAGIGTVVLRPLPDVQPFSIQSGYSFEGILSDMRTWLIYDLVPYLQDQSAAAIFQSNVDTMIDAVNKALTDQSGIVTAALNAAVHDVVNGSVPVSDALIRAVFESATSSTLLYAPAPSGGDDTAAVLPLLLAAQATKGELHLQAGQYRMNLATVQSFTQPRIVGRGKRLTFISPFDPTKPALTYQGGAGGNSGGYLSDLTFNGNGIVGFELADVCNVRWDRVGFDGGNLAESIRFHVTQQNGFTEFNAGEATIDCGTNLAIRYMTDNPQQSSFHGSGLVDGIVNFSGARAVQIDDHAFPYNAPMSATFFAHTANTAIMKNNWANSKPGFYGHLRIENQSGGVVTAADNSGSQILFEGGASVNTALTFLGALFLVYSVYWTAGKTFAHYKPFSRDIALVGGTNYVDVFLNNGEKSLAFVQVIGPNYYAEYTVLLWQNPYNSSGRAAVIDHSIFNNGSGIGEVLFYFENYQFLVKNDAFTSDYSTKIRFAHQGGSIETDNLRQ